MIFIVKSLCIPNICCNFAALFICAGAYMYIHEREALLRNLKQNDMMRKSFLTLSIFLFCLFAMVNTMWADDETTIYLAALRAQKSPASTGDGQVKLTWLDITGKPMQVDLAYQLNFMAVGKYVSSDGPAATAELAGGTLIAIDGMETPMEIGGTGSQIYMTSMLYFHAEAEPADGSYLADWTFTDVAVTRISEPMGSGSEENPYRTPCFKVLPDKANSTLYPPTDGGVALATMAAYVGANPNNIYAVFNKYLLGNPVATGANVEAEENATANLTVTIEVEGDAASLGAADFAAFTFTNNGNSEWSYDLAAALASKVVVSAQKTRITIPVTYTYKNTGYGTKNSTITISMAGENPSTLNVNLSAVALDPDRPEALLLDGKDDASPASGTLSEMLAEDINGYTNPIIKLNKEHADAITLPNKNFTFDLNGNEAGDITIADGNITIAYSSFGGSATSLTVNGGKAILNGGTFGSLTIDASGTVEQNGATITGAATNNGTLTTTNGTFNGGLTSSKTLTLGGGTFKGETAVTISGGTANINRGDISGTSLGLKVTGGTATVKKLAAITSEGSYSVQRTGGTLYVECGKFGKPLNGTINFTSGFFTDQNYGVSTDGYKEMLISAGVEYNEGYRYFLGDSETAQTNGVPVCRIGTVGYAKLEDALAYANNNPGVANIVIFMLNDYTLPSGYYTLPANATIVVPMSDTQEKEINMTAPRVIFNDQNTATPYTSIIPSEFRRLTFASGVNMDVFGNIELTCSQYASNEAYTSQPVGPYGRLVMEEGSRMTLQNGSELRAWGFMTGKGETDARRGSKVREMFQLGDWKGAFTSVEITGMAPDIVADHSDKKIFPVSQYFIQNVESPVKYHPGSLLSSSAAVSEGLLGMSVSMAATDIGIVGVSRANSGGEDDPAIFLMDVAADADNTWVRKWYDVENDVQVYDINSGAHIGSMVLDMGDINLLTYGTIPVRLNSAHFDLPLTCNFKIHLLTGGMDFKQNTSLLPGAEVEVDKEAVVSVAQKPSDTEHTGALYVYDATEWDKYAYCNEFDGLNMEKGTAYTKTVRYAPSWDRDGFNGRPNVRAEQTKPASAKINVHGTFETATGFVYTSESGANIFSSNEDAGTFIFNDDAENAGTRTVYNVKGVGTFEPLTFYPAKLKNGNGEHVNTSTAAKGDAYCYINDEWTTMYPDDDDPCFMVKHNVNGDTYYAKPAEYVAIAATKEGGVFSGNSDHTYSDAAGTGRLFILMDNGCQWWEVENVDNLYHCIHPNNDTYYYWDDEWLEKKYTITWKNWDGTIIPTTNEDGVLVNNYDVTYGTMAEFLGTNPTRESNIDYTYDFTGWSPALGPVTNDVTYTATYEQKDRMYTITFLNEGGTLIETQFLKHNDVPVCENTPTKVGHTLVWSPAIAAVTSDATYTATFEEDPPTAYDITFFDYDGETVLQEISDVPVGQMPEYTNPTPTGKATWAAAQDNKEYTYVFDHWSPAIEVVSATSVKSYTAVYREVVVKYNVRFEDENGDEIETNQYAYGEMPVCSATPTKENTAQYTYSFTWTPQIQTVQGAATYRAEFTPTTNKYTVTLIANPAGACTFSGAGVYEYGEEVNIAAIFDSGKYRFLNWSDDETNAVRATQTVSDNITLTAYLEAVLENDLEIGVGEIEELTGPTTKENLIITSNGVTSGQLINANNLILTGDAFFDITPAGGFDARKWYAVAVPWQVNTTDGILINGVSQNVGTDLDVLYYNGSQRATAGKGNNDWNRIENEVDKTMYPGTLYMIYLAHSASTIRFKKAAGVNILTTTLSVEAHPSAITTDAGWNGIANPALYHGYIDPDATTYTKHNFGQKYKPDQMSYDAVDMASAPMIVGEPIFVQVAASNAITVATSNPFSAPALRRSIVDNAYYEVQISAGEDYTDRIYLQTLEDKEDTYVIGLDLAKAGVSTKVAQMWVDRYNTKLCVNTTAPVGSSATYPLGIFVPQDGNYQIYSATEMQAGQEMFVTRNGHTIWNLAYGPYTATLSAGTNNEYGLKLIQVPAATTGIDPVTNDQLPMTNKVVIDDHVYIIRDGEIYTVTGQKIQ